MNSELKTFINDAHNFQNYGQYDLAIDSLKQAQQLDQQHELETEIQKLLSFNYRKLGDFNMALFHINNAINSITNVQTEDYAICLMNKGIIFEEQKSSNKAIKCYLSALDIFTDLFNHDTDNYGKIINAFMTIGMFYYNCHDYLKTKKYLESALPYFDENKETDRQYLAIINTLSELKNII